MPGAHTTAHLRRDRSTSHSVFFFFARCSERGERPHQPAAPNEEGSRATHLRNNRSTPKPAFTFAIRRSERGGRPRQPAGKGPPQPESYPPSPSAIPNAQGRGGTTPSASPGPSANPANPAPSTPPPAPYYKKGAPSGHAAAPSLFPQPRPATAPRTTLVPAASHPGFPALRYLPISSEPPSVLVPAASRPAPRTPAPPTSFPAAPPPSSFPRSSVPLPAIAPAGIGVAQTGIPVIPRSAQSAIFAPSDPSPDIRIPWQTSSNA